MDPTEHFVEPFANATRLIDTCNTLCAEGTGWINMMPTIHPDVPVPPTPSLLAVFSKRGPVVPMGTWTTPTTTKKATIPAELGIQHGIGAKVQPHVAETDAEIPSDWRILSDHPRRGFTVRPAPEASVEVQITWMLHALSELCIPPHEPTLDVFVYRPQK